MYTVLCVCVRLLYSTDIVRNNLALTTEGSLIRERFLYSTDIARINPVLMTEGSIIIREVTIWSTDIVTTNLALKQQRGIKY